MSASTELLCDSPRRFHGTQATVGATPRAVIAAGSQLRRRPAARFLGRETLGGARTPPYMSDPELADHVLHVLDDIGPRCFSSSRSPWAITGRGSVKDRRSEQGTWAACAQSDEMLRRFIEGLERRRRRAAPRLLRRPSAEPAARFRAAPAPTTGAATMRSGRPQRRPPSRRDLPAHELGRLLGRHRAGAAK